jgi:TPR repeat protein
MIAGVLAVGLLLTGAVQAHAGTAPPDEPPDVAGLAWREACHLPHAHVRPPLWAAPVLRSYGLPTVARGSAWSSSQLVRLGWLFAGGTLTGAPAYGEARRLYCLALRRDGHVPAAVLLGELHAEGWGVPRSPRLAAHFARVGALGWHGEPEFLSSRVAQFDLEQLDPAGQDRQEAAAAWLAAPGPQAATDFAGLAARYRAGRAVPRSDLLANYLLYRAQEQDPRYVVPYVRHFLHAHREWIAAEWLIRSTLVDKVRKVLGHPEFPEVRAFYGSLYLEGVLLERNVMAGALWICSAHQYGAAVGAPWCAWLRTRTTSEIQAGVSDMKFYDLPYLLRDFRRR